MVIFVQNLRSRALVIAATFLCFPWVAFAAAQELKPQSDSEVIERLPPRIKTAVKSDNANPISAAKAAQAWISLARREGDPRYLGRAQTVLAAWWGRADAPVDIAVLQATVQQSRHEFEAARQTLAAALKRSPNHAQGWLTMATLERLQGRYKAALAACEAVQRAGAALYAQACALETRSLQGDTDKASRGFASLIAQTTEPSLAAWLGSLQAEHLERAGQDVAALQSYQISLKLDGDGYTALAMADLLLRSARPREALAVLANQPLSDAVLLRRAYALKLAGKAEWKQAQNELQERFAASAARGDDAALHAREQALAALWLAEDLTSAARHAQVNWQLQKEPLDWLIAFKCVNAITNPAFFATLKGALKDSGLQDERLAQWQTGNRQGFKSAP